MRFNCSGCAWQNGAYDKYIHLNSVNEYGYFWTSTEDKDNELAVSTVWFRKIFATQSTVYRGTSPGHTDAGALLPGCSKVV